VKTRFCAKGEHWHDLPRTQVAFIVRLNPFFGRLPMMEELASQVPDKCSMMKNAQLSAFSQASSIRSSPRAYFRQASLPYPTSRAPRVLCAIHDRSYGRLSLGRRE
jgi:hypothetical protein